MSSSSESSAQPKRPSLLASFSRTFSTSSSAVPAAVPTSGDDQTATNAPQQNTRLRTLVKTLTWVGTKVAETVDYVGEGVVSVLGLDDSRFQDVLDNMTEEEREQAEAVHAERQQEYRDAGILIDEAIPSDDVVAEVSTVSSSGNSVKIVDVEAGSGSDTNNIDGSSGGEVELKLSSGGAKVSQSSSDVVDNKDIVVSTAENNV